MLEQRFCSEDVKIEAEALLAKVMGPTRQEVVDRGRGVDKNQQPRTQVSSVHFFLFDYVQFQGVGFRSVAARQDYSGDQEQSSSVTLVRVGGQDDDSNPDDTLESKEQEGGED